jgi:hypothetical protein
MSLWIASSVLVYYRIEKKSPKLQLRAFKNKVPQTAGTKQSVITFYTLQYFPAVCKAGGE